MCQIIGVLFTLLLVSTSISASSLRHKLVGQQLFGECAHIGAQCRGIAHSICAEAPTRMKRNAADSELMFSQGLSPRLKARDGLDYGSDGDNVDEQESSNHQTRGKTEILPPILKETEKTNVFNDVKHIYKDIHTRSRVDVNQKVVQKHVYIHDVKKIHRDLTVNHVNHNHRTDVIKHVQPILNELYITREQKIIQPIEKTVIRRTQSESEKELVHPTIVQNKYRKVRLPTVVENTRNLGTVEVDNGRINRGGEWRNDEGGNGGGYGGELDERAAINLPMRRTNEQAVADALARFKRAADNGVDAVCMCAEGFVPNKSLDGCF